MIFSISVFPCNKLSRRRQNRCAGLIKCVDFIKRSAATSVLVYTYALDCNQQCKLVFYCRLMIFIVIVDCFLVDVTCKSILSGIYRQRHLLFCFCSWRLSYGGAVFVFIATCRC